MPQRQLTLLTVLALVCFAADLAIAADGQTGARSLQDAIAVAESRVLETESRLELTNERLSALQLLAAKNHASRAEVIAAERDRTVAVAQYEIATAWATLLGCVMSTNGGIEPIFLDGSELIALPAVKTDDQIETDNQPADASVESSPSAAQMESISAIAMLEHASLPFALLAHDRAVLTSYRDRLREIHADSSEVESADRELADVVKATASVRRRAERLDRWSTEHPIEAGTRDTDAALATAAAILELQTRSNLHSAVFATSRQLLRTRAMLSAAEHELVAATDWRDELARIDAAHRRPEESTIADRRVQRAALVVESQRCRLAVSCAAIEFLNSLDHSDEQIAWQSLAGNSFANTHHVGFANPAPRGLALQYPLRKADVQARDIAWQASQRGPRSNDELFSQRSTWSDRTRAGLARETADRELTKAFTRPSFRFESPYRDIGRRYNAGYAFGRLSSDLPASLRLPHADGYGEHWYLPGHPINELRLRYRLPLDAR